MKPKKILWVVIVVISLLLVPLIYTQILEEYIIHTLLLFTFFWGGYLVDIQIAQKVNLKWKKAELEELKIEDSALMEGIGIFQGILFVYLELIRSEVFFINVLKWSIPSVTILFFILRAYGAIKNSPRHRYWSSMILVYYLIFQLFLTLTIIISDNLRFLIGSYNIVPLYISYLYIFLISSFNNTIRNAMKKRYGHN